MFPQGLETELVSLRRPTTKDAEDYGEAVRASIDDLAEWLQWAQVRKRLRDLDDWKSMMEDLDRRFQTGELYTWLIRPLDEPERLVGEITLDTSDWERDRVLEYQVWIRSDFAGRGFGSNASHAIFELVFDGLDAQMVEGLVHPRNFRSRRLLTAMGFKKYGSSRTDHDRMVIFPYDWARQCHSHVLRRLSGLEP